MYHLWSFHKGQNIYIYVYSYKCTCNFSLNFKDLDIRHPENNVFYVTIVNLFTLTALNFLHSQKPVTLYFSGFLSNGGYDK